MTLHISRSDFLQTCSKESFEANFCIVESGFWHTCFKKDFLHTSFKGWLYPVKFKAEMSNIFMIYKLVHLHGFQWVTFCILSGSGHLGIAYKLQSLALCIQFLGSISLQAMYSSSKGTFFKRCPRTDFLQ